MTDLGPHGAQRRKDVKRNAVEGRAGGGGVEAKEHGEGRRTGRGREPGADHDAGKGAGGGAQGMAEGTERDAARTWAHGAMLVASVGVVATAAATGYGGGLGVLATGACLWVVVVLALGLVVELMGPNGERPLRDWGRGGWRAAVACVVGASVYACLGVLTLVLAEGPLLPGAAG